MDSLSEEVQYFVLQKPECLAYQIPPSARASGHMAGEWSRNIFKGKMRVVAQGTRLVIQLMSSENSLFVACPVDPKAIEKSVERVQDSSRYFVLRVVGPNGQHMFIGMGFEQRNDAFDFWASLVDFQRQIEAETRDEIQGPDMSHLQLREGQTITLGSAPSQPKPASGGLFKLKPPPRK